MHQVGAGVLGPVFRAYDPDADRTVALKSFPLDITPEQAAEFAAELQRLASLDLNHPSLIAPRGAGVEGHNAYLVEDYFVAESIDTAIRQYGPAPAPDAVRLIGQLAGSLDFAAAVGVHHGALHPRDVLVAPREVRMTGIGVAGGLENIGFRPAARRPYSAPERAEGGEPTLAADLYSLAVIAHELLTGRRPATAGDALQADVGAVTAAEPAALAEAFARAFSVRPEDRFPSALAFAGALKHALTAQPIEQAADAAAGSAGDAAKEAGSGAERARSRRPRAGGRIAPVPVPLESASPVGREAGPTTASVGGPTPAVDAVAPAGPPSVGDAVGPASLPAEHGHAVGPALGHGVGPASLPAEDGHAVGPASLPADDSIPASSAAGEATSVPPEVRPATPPPDAGRDTSPVPDSLFPPESELPEPPPLTLDDLDLRTEAPELPLLDQPEERERPTGPFSLGEAPPPPSETTAAAAHRAPREWSRPAEPEPADAPQGRGPTNRTAGTRGFERPVRQKRRVSGVALLLMLLFGILLGLGAGYYFAVRDTGNAIPASGEGPAAGGQAAPSQPSATTAPQGAPASSPTAVLPPLEGTVPPLSSTTPSSSATAGPPPGAAAAGAGSGSATRELVPEPDTRAKAGGAAAGSEGRRGLKARPAAPRAKAKTPARQVPDAEAGAERSRRQVFEGSLAVISKPSGARVFVDGHPVGTTPMTLPRLSAGSHVVRLERDGYSPWSGAIQVVAGEQNRVTASLEQRPSR